MADLQFPDFDEVEIGGGIGDNDFPAFDEVDIPDFDSVDIGDGGKKPRIGIRDTLKLRSQQRTGIEPDSTAHAIVENFPFNRAMRSADQKAIVNFYEGNFPDYKKKPLDEGARRYLGEKGVARYEQESDADRLAGYLERQGGFAKESVRMWRQFEEPKLKPEEREESLKGWLQKDAERELKDRIEAKRAAGKVLDEHERSIWNKMVVGAAENAGYMAQFTVPGGVGLSFATSAAERTTRLSTDEYDVDDDGNLYLSKAGDDEVTAALKGITGAAAETLIEVGGGKVAGKLLGKGARVILRGVGKKAPVTANLIGKAIKKYVQLAEVTKLHDPISETWFEEYPQALVDSGLGLDLKQSEMKGKPFAERMLKAHNDFDPVEVMLSMAFLMAGQATMSTASATMDHKTLNRNLDNCLKLFGGLEDADLKGVSTKDKILMARRVAGTMTPEKVEVLTRHLDAKAQQALKKAYDRQQFYQQAQAEGVEPTFTLGGDGRNPYVDTKSGIGIIPEDGKYRVVNRDGADIGVFNSAGEAIAEAKKQSQVNVVLDQQRQKKADYALKEAERLAGGMPVRVFNTEAEMLQEIPEIAESPDYQEGITGVRHKGGMVLILDNLISPSEVVRTIMHEGGAHEGIRRVLGDKAGLNQFLGNLSGKQFELGKRRLKLGGQEFIDQLTEADEALAVVYEHRLADPTAYQKSVSWLHDQLRKVNPNAKYTDADIEVLMADAQQKVMQAEGNVERSYIGVDRGYSGAEAAVKDARARMSQEARAAEQARRRRMADEANKPRVAPVDDDAATPPKAPTQPQQRGMNQKERRAALIAGMELEGSGVSYPVEDAVKHEPDQDRDPAAQVETQAGDTAKQIVRQMESDERLKARYPQEYQDALDAVDGDAANAIGLLREQVKAMEETRREREQGRTILDKLDNKRTLTPQDVRFLAANDILGPDLYKLGYRRVKATGEWRHIDEPTTPPSTPTAPTSQPQAPVADAQAANEQGVSASLSLDSATAEPLPWTVTSKDGSRLVFRSQAEAQAVADKWNRLVPETEAVVNAPSPAPRSPSPEASAPGTLKSETEPTDNTPGGRAGVGDIVQQESKTAPVAKESFTTEDPADEEASRQEALRKSKVFKEKLKAKYPPVDVRTDEILVQAEGFKQFKEDADPATGVVEEQRLMGRPYSLAENPIVVIEMNDGRKVIVTGRHRLDLYKRNNIETIPAHIIRESDGWTPDDAGVLDAFLNILDEKGSIHDYVKFFDEVNPTASEAEADGLTSREKGRTAFLISQSASPDVRASINFDAKYRRRKENGEHADITAAQAAAIAEAAPIGEAPENEAIQREVLRDAFKGMTPLELRNRAQVYKRQIASSGMPESAQMDLFGDSGAGLREQADKIADAISAKQSELMNLRAVLNNALNRGDALQLTKAKAKALGITNVKDKAQLRKALDATKKELAYWSVEILDEGRMNQARRAAGVPVVDDVPKQPTTREVKTGLKGQTKTVPVEIPTSGEPTTTIVGRRESDAKPGLTLESVTIDDINAEVSARNAEAVRKEMLERAASPLEGNAGDLTAELFSDLDGETPLFNARRDTPAKPSFEAMQKEAQRWQGAHMNAEKMLLDAGDRRGAMKVAASSGKSNLDDYLIKKFGVDRATAHEVSNAITQFDMPADRTAKVEDFAGEEWADAAIKSQAPSSSPTAPSSAVKRDGATSQAAQVPGEAPSIRVGSTVKHVDYSGKTAVVEAMTSGGASARIKWQDGTTSKVQTKFLSVVQPQEAPAAPTVRFRRASDAEYLAVVEAYTNKDGSKKAGWMLAPNGKPTNLQERQWVQVRTPAFKAWFGDWEKFASVPGGVWADLQEEVSKVVDENGEPLEVYHGTQKFGFTVMDPYKADKHRSPMVFMSSHYGTARSYSDGAYVRHLKTIEEEVTDDVKQYASDVLWWEWETEAERDALWNDLSEIEKADLLADYRSAYGDEADGGGVYPLFLNIRNPLESNFEGRNWDGQSNGLFQVTDEDGEVQYAEDGSGTFTEEDAEAFAESLSEKTGKSYKWEEAHGFDTTNSVAEEAKKSGNDGAIIRRVFDDGGRGGAADVSDVFVIFKANQAKSTIDNTGTFNAGNDDIRFRRASDADNLAEPFPMKPSMEVTKVEDIEDNYNKLMQWKKDVAAWADKAPRVLPFIFTYDESSRPELVGNGHVNVVHANTRNTEKPWRYSSFSHKNGVVDMTPNGHSEFKTKGEAVVAAMSTPGTKYDPDIRFRRLLTEVDREYLAAAQTAVDNAPTMAEKRRALDEWKAKNPEAVREIEGEQSPRVNPQQARAEGRYVSRPTYAEPDLSTADVAFYGGSRFADGFLYRGIEGEAALADIASKGQITSTSETAKRLGKNAHVGMTFLTDYPNIASSYVQRDGYVLEIRMPQDITAEGGGEIQTTRPIPADKISRIFAVGTDAEGPYSIDVTDRFTSPLALRPDGTLAGVQEQADTRFRRAVTPDVEREFASLTSTLKLPKGTRAERQAALDEWIKGNPKEYAALEKLRGDVLKAAGYTIKGFHNSGSRFNVFDLGTARTSSDIQGFFFKDQRDSYQEYGPVEYSVFLKVQNPAKDEQALEGFSPASTDDAGVVHREKLISQGYDGAIFSKEWSGMDYTEIVVFDPSQIKSADPLALDDSGELITPRRWAEEDTEDIRFRPGPRSLPQRRVQLTPEQQEVMREAARPITQQQDGIKRAVATEQEAPILGLIRWGMGQDVADKIDRKLGDFRIPIKRLYERVMEKGGKFNRDTMEYAALAEKRNSLFGVLAGDMEEQFVLPMTKALRDGGWSLDDLNHYAQALHAPDFNRMITDARGGREAPGRQPLGGYATDLLSALEEDGWAGKGLSDAKAKETVEWFERQAGADKLREAASYLVFMNRRILDQRVADGLMARQQAETWKKLSPYYVPLRKMQEAEEGAIAAPAGRNLSSREIKRAVGHFGTLNENSVVNSLTQMDAALYRGLMNKERQNLWRFLEANPDPDSYVLHEAVPTREVKVRNADGTFTVQQQVDQGFVRKASPQDKEGTIVPVKFDGDVKYIEFKGVNARTAARAVKENALQGRAFAASPFIRGLGHMFKGVRTIYSVDFMLRNGQSDGLDAALIMAAEGNGKQALEAVKAVPHAWKVLWQHENGRPVTGPYAELFDEYRRSGSIMSNRWVDSTGDNWLKVLEKEMGIKPDHSKPVQAVIAVKDGIERLNTIVELGTRFSVYAGMRKNGASIQDAADYARNITVDFEKKGELTPVLNSVYHFSNVAIQGNRRFMQAMLKNPARGARVVGSVFAAGFLTALWNMLGFDDDDDEYDKLKDYHKYGRIAARIPGTKKMVQARFRGIPGWIYFQGVAAAETAFGKRTAGSFAMQAPITFLDTVNWLGDSSDLLTAVLPPMLDPLAHFATNKQWTGRPLVPGLEYATHKPRSQLAYKSTPKVFKAVAEAINKLGGGDEVTKSNAMLDNSPEAYKYWWRFLTGSMLNVPTRSFDVMVRLAKGEDIPVKSVPFVRDFFLDLDDIENNEPFYQAKTAFEEVQYRYKGYDERGERGKMGELRRQHRYADRESIASDRLKDILRRIDDLKDRADAATGERKEQLNQQRVEAQRKFIELIERYDARGRQP